MTQLDENKFLDTYPMMRMTIIKVYLEALLENC